MAENSLTKREQFAAAALQGMLADGANTSDLIIDEIVAYAFQYADEMISQGGGK